MLLLFGRPANAAEEYSPVGLSAPQVFALNRHATGELQQGAYHTVTQTTSDRGEVWTAESYLDAGNYRTTVRVGDFVWAGGRYDGRAWSRDPNGFMRRSTNFFFQTDPFATSLRAPQNPASGVKVVGETTSPPLQIVIEITPSKGLLERRYYDAGTYLLSKVQMIDFDGHRQAWLYDSYRKFSGLNVPQLVRYERDGSAVTGQTQLVTYDRVTAGMPSLAVPPSRPLFDMGAADEVTIPAQFTPAGIIVPVVIGGRTLDFLLDSGSSEMLLDPGVAQSLGMQTIGATQPSFAGDFTLANTHAPSIGVGVLSAANVAFSTAHFEEDLPGRRVVGLLGTDFIASGLLEVSFETQRLTVLRSLPADLAARGWSPLPLRLDENVPMVKVTFSGIDGYFVADQSMLFPHYFARFPNRVPRGTPGWGELVGIGNRPFGVKSITMRDMVLGDWVFAEAQVVVPSVQYAQDRGYDGLIGRNTLANFDLIFDYADSQLWFKPIDFK